VKLIAAELREVRALFQEDFLHASSLPRFGWIDLKVEI
jgi:hypothetical protein